MKVKQTGTVLCYNMNANKLENICKKLGIRLKIVEKSDFNKTIGEMVGFNQDNKTRDASDFSDEMLVIYNLKGTSLDRFLRVMRENDIEIPYKAVLTSTNMDWLPKDLCEELKLEHDQMNSD